MRAHICGIDRFHIHFIGVKIDIFLLVSKPGVPSPVLSAKQPHRKVPCVRYVDGRGAPLPDIGPWRTRWGVLYVHRGCRCAAIWRKVGVRADEIPRRCACGISCRPRGPDNKNSQLLAQPAAWSQKGCGEDESKCPYFAAYCETTRFLSKPFK